MNNKLTTKQFKEMFENKLFHHFGVSMDEATDDHYYKAVALIVNDIMAQRRKEFEKKANENGKKQVYYLCMEFLLGRSLKNALYNLGIEKTVRSVLTKLDINLDYLYEMEPDAGLGNGGLGRLAACFMDSLATLKYPAMGYSLRYEYGIFRQKLIDGWQSELPDFWLPGGSVWLNPHPEKAITVKFDGRLIDKWDGSYHNSELVDYRRVVAVPYDLLIPGKDGMGISRLRLWAAESPDFDMSLFNEGDYLRAMEQNAMAEVITKVLYPEDNHPEGKSLRLNQQYFLVSATIQDIISRHLRVYGTLESLPDYVAIHLNDTHPVLAISEMMRIMLDECGYHWEESWDIVTRTIAYTNHTVMSEALECWDSKLFKTKLPRNYQIVEEINRRFSQDLLDLGVNAQQADKMAIIKDDIVRMANLAVVGSHSVNGVSALHTNILKETVFNDFYKIMPEKFTNVTNGIAHRRWLNQANPELSSFIYELIGDDCSLKPDNLKKLEKFKDDSAALERLEKIKLNNKKKLAQYVKKHNNIIIDPESIYDVQVKRLHEYKRQHLNALHILSTYQWLRDNPNADFVPKTYIFGAKAAPGYYFAKQIIRFIANLAKTINNDPRVNKKLKVIYLEDYRVTVAEKLIPSAEISEQISLAGTEASGTSNMKFMINGAVTLGTEDGANVEIHEAVGDDNIFIFGMKTNEVKKIETAGYKPLNYYNNNNIIKRAVDELINPGFCGVQFNEISQSLIAHDPYMVLADFADYSAKQQLVSKEYLNRKKWNRMSLINIANAGRFSSDRAIKDYANNIWDMKPLN